MFHVGDIEKTRIMKRQVGVWGVPSNLGPMQVETVRSDPNA